jgi:MinD superfamily P-loop ATPase
MIRSAEPIIPSFHVSFIPIVSDRRFHMAAQIDMDKCTMCGGYTSTLCVEVCPDLAIRVQDGRPVVTEFLCEDCNECGCICPDEAITIPLEKVTF